MAVPLLDLTAQAKALQADLEAAVSQVIASGQYVLGKHVEEFEEALAGRCGVPVAVGVNSGTDALELALRALGIGPGDEVLVPAFTFMSTALAVSAAGATPVFVDIDEASYGIDVEDGARRVTPRSRAIVPVHLYGQPCDLDGVLQLARRAKLRVIEDCAQAIGALYRGYPVGSFGDAGCFSFYPTKNLGAIGDGGAVVAKEGEVAERLKLLRNCGTRDKVRYERYGRNSRLDEVQAAILRVKLKHLDRWNDARRERAQWYREQITYDRLEQVRVPVELPQRHHVYHAFVVRVPDRDRVHRQLASRGIQTGVYYARPLYQDSIYAAEGGPRLPRAEAAAASVLALPLYPELRREDVMTVVDELKRVLAGTRTLAA